jgi:hypothetical protein
MPAMPAMPRRSLCRSGRKNGRGKHCGKGGADKKALESFHLFLLQKRYLHNA